MSIGPTMLMHIGVWGRVVDKKKAKMVQDTSTISG